MCWCSGTFRSRWFTPGPIPEGYRPALLPKDVELKNEAGRFAARFVDRGDRLAVSVELVLTKDVYAPEDYSALKKLIETAVGALSQPIVLERQP